MKKLTLKDLKESDIQHLYYQFAYLIEKKFINYEKEQFVKIKSGIIDILVKNESEIVVIELKKEPLVDSHVLQLYQYLQEMRELNKDKRISGILIGKKEKNDLNSLLKTFDFEVKVKILETDIPINIKICNNCRCANPIHIDFCFNCKGKNWLL